MAQAIRRGQTRWPSGDGEMAARPGRPAAAAADHKRTRTDAASPPHEGGQAFLLALTDALRPLADPLEVQQAASVMLGGHLGVSRAFYYGVERDGPHNVHVVERDFYRDPAMPSMIGRYPQTAFGEGVFSDLSHDRTLAVPDVHALAILSGEELERYLALQIEAFVAVPLVKNGDYVAGFAILHASPRAWTPGEIALIEDTAERTWSAVERARAEDALRRSDDRLRALNDELEQRVEERTAQIMALFKRLVSVQEDERRRIARDIHDQLGQQMTALRLNIEALKAKASRGRDVLGQVQRTQRLAEELDQSIDFLTWELRPAALDHLGLPAALRHLVAGWSDRYGVDAGVDVSGAEGDRLPIEVEANLYRIAQEALHNVLKHAQATHVLVRLERTRGATVLAIADDGLGFVPSESREPNDGRSLGLIGMRERATLAGGRLEIASAPGRGASIVVRIPAGARIF